MSRKGSDSPYPLHNKKLHFWVEFFVIRYGRSRTGARVTERAQVAVRSVPDRESDASGDSPYPLQVKKSLSNKGFFDTAQHESDPRSFLKERPQSRNA